MIILFLLIGFAMPLLIMVLVIAVPGQISDIRALYTWIKKKRL